MRWARWRRSSASSRRRPPFGAEADPFVLPHEKVGAEFFFQLLDRLADHAGADGDRLRGLVDVFELGGGDEVAKLVEGHGFS